MLTSVMIHSCVLSTNPFDSSATGVGAVFDFDVGSAMRSAWVDTDSILAMKRVIGRILRLELAHRGRSRFEPVPRRPPGDAEARRHHGHQHDDDQRGCNHTRHAPARQHLDRRRQQQRDEDREQHGHDGLLRKLQRTDERHAGDQPQRVARPRQSKSCHVAADPAAAAAWAAGKRGSVIAASIRLARRECTRLSCVVRRLRRTRLPSRSEAGTAAYDRNLSRSPIQAHPPGTCACFFGSAMHDLQDRVADLLVQHELRVGGDCLQHPGIEHQLALGRFVDDVARAQALDEIAEQRAIEELG